MSYFKSFYKELGIRVQDADEKDLEYISKMVIRVKERNSKIIIIGNGGSAGIASHLAVDFTKAIEVRAVTFNDSSLITCFGNDYGYENWVEKAIAFYGMQDDLVILISSSGQSQNIVLGAKKAIAMGLEVVTLSGFKEDNPLKSLGTKNLYTSSSVYNIVENVHQIWLTVVVDFIREATSYGKSLLKKS